MSVKLDLVYQKWRSELLDLSRRNPLVHLGDKTRSSLQCIHPATTELFLRMAHEECSLSVFREEANGADVYDQADLTAQLQLVMTEDIDDDASPKASTEAITREPGADEIRFKGDAKTVTAAMTRYRQRARSAMIEQGVEILYLTFGVLEWYESENSDQLFRSPLVLLPVRIARDTVSSLITLTPTGDDPFLNPVLARILSESFGIKLDYVFDDTTTWDSLSRSLYSQLHVFARWQLLDSIYLGLLSFSKFAMYQDLEDHRELFLQHPIIRMLTGLAADLVDADISVPSAERLDAETTPSNTFHVLDADASQHEAIEAAKRGRHLVIQGPPGTGKSQTITNIIAEFLANGQSVLFVSEKMAALQVVHKRLAEAGLSDFCVLLHSDATQRGPIIQSLARMLDLADEPTYAPMPMDSPMDSDRIIRLREQLNEYVRALHSNSNPLGKTVFHAHGQVAIRQNAPRLTFTIDDVGHLDHNRLVTMDEAIQQLIPVAGVVLEASTHPWRHCTIPEYTFSISDDLASWLSQLMINADEGSTRQHDIRDLWGLSPDTSLTGARWLTKLFPILQRRTEIIDEWLTLPTIRPHMSFAQDRLRNQEAYEAGMESLAGRYLLDILSLDLDTLQDRLLIGGGDTARRIQGDGDPGTRALAQRHLLVRAWERSLSAAAGARRMSEHAAHLTGLPVAQSSSELQRQAHMLHQILSIPHPSSSWFERSQHEHLRDLCAEGINAQSVTRERAEQLRSRYSESVLQPEMLVILNRLESDYASPLRIIQPGYHREIKITRAFLAGASGLSYSEAMELLNALRSYDAARAWLESNDQVLRHELGPDFRGADTDWEHLSASMTLLFTMLDKWPLFPGLLQGHMLRDERNDSQLQELVTRIDAVIAEYSAATVELRQLIDIPAKTIAEHPWSLPFSDFEHIVDHDKQQLTQFWSALDTIQEHSLTLNLSLTDARQAIDGAQKVLGLRALLGSEQDDPRGLFGALFTGPETDWRKILNALRWVQEVRAHLGEPASAFFTNRLGIAPLIDEDWVSLEAVVANIDELLGHLERCFSADGFRSNETMLYNASLESISAWADGLLESMDQLQAWIDYQRLAKEAASAGLTSFFREVRQRKIPQNEWIDGFYRRMYSAWIDHQYREHPVLARFRGHAHEQSIARFRDLDSQQFSYNSRRIASTLRNRIPETQYALPTSEPGKLRRAAAAKRRFKPLRTLFSEIPSLLLTLKPCMIMNPLSVARHLEEPSIRFDLVIFDEASQILPADAIGSIGRSKQVIVVGDTQQLPPSDFFKTHIGGTDDEDDDDEETPESILDAFLATGIPLKRLKWHYRSRHEELIAFSNREFYESQLITFPSVNADARPIEFVHVEDGIYDRGGSRTNTIEARRVAGLVIEHARSSPDQSLGVIAFSVAQMMAVRQALEIEKRADPTLEALLNEDRHDGFFVKSLEEVQGDERDVIIFSIGYGFDQAGKMTMSFGPVNRQGGERRLNVAVTRARERVIVVASFRPDDIDLSRTKARGVHLLRSYLAFAERGPIALESVVTREGGDPESPFEEAVAIALTRAGLAIIPQVGVGGYRIDIGVRDPDTGRYVLGVECDGATYHSSKTARDRDRLRQQVLENLGWTIHRIWSRDWNSDPNGQTQKVVDAYNSAKSKLADARPKPVPASMIENSGSRAVPIEASHENPRIKHRSIQDALPSQPLTGIASPYQAASLDFYPPIYGVENATSGRLIDMVTACVEKESPVHEERVMRGVAAALYVERVGARIRSQLLQSIAAAERRRLVIRRGDFLWSPSMTQPPVRGKDASGKARKIEEVAPEEIAACILGVLDYSFSLNNDDLTKAVARELGYSRTGETIFSAIRSQIMLMIGSQELRNQEGMISIVR